MGYWVVVVDDDVTALRNAKNLLSEQNLRVSCLRSGADLLKFMEVYTPDIVILDILMPEMDGFECYRALRQMEEENSRVPTPVIFLTGDQEHEYERRGLRCGASDFMHKPFDKDVLIKRITNTIENRKTIEKLTKRASMDKLTGFLNKASGTEKIAALCKESQGALIMLDLDNFKLINDFYGHDMGDQVLIAFSDIMRQNTRVEDVITRIGGDEFLAYFMDVTQEVSVKALVRRLNDQLHDKCVELMGAEFDIPIGISAGVAFAPEHSTDFDLLFRYADASMYKVKQNGKHGVEIFDKSEDELMIDNTNTIDEDLNQVIRVVSERGVTEGAVVLGKDVFVHIYQYVVRTLKLYKRNAGRVLFRLSIESEVENMADYESCLQDVMLRNLRERDVAVQPKRNQFFALMPDITQDEIDEITKKISDEWLKEVPGGEVALNCVSELVTYSDL